MSIKFSPSLKIGIKNVEQKKWDLCKNTNPIKDYLR